MSRVFGKRRNAICKWAEARGGRPAKVSTGRPGGILRIDFGEPDEGLTEITWEEFFTIFEDRRLAFLHQHRVDDGGMSRFNKVVDR